MPSPQILAFYATPAPITAPGRYAKLVDELPNDPEALIRAVPGVVIREYLADHYGDPCLTSEKRSHTSGLSRPCSRELPRSTRRRCRTHDRPQNDSLESAGISRYCSRRSFAPSVFRHASDAGSARISTHGWPSITSSRSTGASLDHAGCASTRNAALGCMGRHAEAGRHARRR